MRRIYVMLFTLTLCAQATAQSFEELLTSAVNKFERSDTLRSKMNAANQIDLIAGKWNDQWTAHYYSAYTKLVLSQLLTGEKQRDAIIDQAETEIAEVRRLKGATDDEMLVMDAFAASARLSVKSGSRWKKYGAIFDAKIDEARKLNPANPRIYYLKGESLYYTPRAFGGGTKNALPQFEKAASYFQNEPKDKLTTIHWGAYRNEYYINECKKG
jgi:hypothetical protein